MLKDSALETMPLPGLDDIQAAATTLAPVAVETPLLRAPAIDRLTGGRVLIKPEMLQRTGSFKFRGAYNKISRIPASCAAASWHLLRQPRARSGCRRPTARYASTIVMPADAPAIKIENTRATAPRWCCTIAIQEDREAIAAEIADRTGAALVQPYDDPDIIAGQGTVGLELCGKRSAGVRLDLVLAPCGGGGLMAGCATAREGLVRRRGHTVEPEVSTIWPARSPRAS